MNLLHTIGLMTRAEHERLMSNRVSIAIHNDVVNAFREQLANKDAKFKLAATDLERVVIRNQELMFEKGRLAAANSSLRSEINDLRPDAEAMRKKRDADRARRKTSQVQP